MRRPSNCWCSGTWKAKLPRWGCLKRLGDRSLLYCKVCRQEWWSKKGCAARVPMWEKEVRSGLSDQDILLRLVTGSLRVREEGGLVIVESDSHKGTNVLKQIERQVHQWTTYRFVCICSAGRQKKIAVHRLNWMSHHLKLVPEGFHVDHVNGRGDVFDNLQLLPAAENCRTNV